MSKKMHASYIDKVEQFLKQQEKLNDKLNRLYEKRKMEIGALAVKYGLDKWDNKKIEDCFKKIIDTSPDEHSN